MHGRLISVMQGFSNSIVLTTKPRIDAIRSFYIKARPGVWGQLAILGHIVNVTLRYPKSSVRHPCLTFLYMNTLL